MGTLQFPLSYYIKDPTIKNQKSSSVIFHLDVLARRENHERFDVAIK
jgi:hypothetical protein